MTAGINYIRNYRCWKKTFFSGGRLGHYKYFNMDQIIESAILLYNRIADHHHLERAFTERGAGSF
jgi:UDP-galactopyranose mutase